MEMLEEYPDEQETILIYNIEHRIIWLDGYVDEEQACELSFILDELNSIDSREILFFVSGSGGNFNSFLMMDQFLQYSESDIMIVAFDRVESGSFLITQILDGIRLAVEDTSFRFHNGVDVFNVESFGSIELNCKAYQRGLKRLKTIDSLQMLWFTRRAEPYESVYELFDK